MKYPRPFVPLDAEFFDDARVLELAPLTQLVYLRGLTLAKRIQTDGQFTSGQLRRQCGDIEELETHVKSLVACDLWTDEGPDEYTIASWQRWNKSQAEWEAELKLARDSGRRGGRKSGEVRSAKAAAKGTLQGDPSRVDEPDPTDQTQPEEKHTNRPITRANAIDAYVRHRQQQGGIDNAVGFRKWVDRDWGLWIDNYVSSHPSARVEQVGDALQAAMDRGRTDGTAIF
jgi:hypothetical protein